MQGAMYYLIVIALGMLVPVQTAANGRLRGRVQSAWVATLISFAVSSCVLTGASAIVGMPLWPTSVQVGAAPWWSWGGGLVALLTITAYMYLFRELGMLQATILPIVGQLMFSLVIDHFGLFHTAQIAFTPLRALAALLLISGAVLAIMRQGQQREAEGAYNPRIAAWQLLGVGCGCLLASMGAIYGSLGQALGSATQASACSFAIATASMLLCCTVTGQVGAVLRAFNRQDPWWMWLGGIVGAVSVCGTAWLLPQLGAGVFFMLLLIGQIAQGLCMEWRGWLGAVRRRISAAQIAGVLLMVTGILIIKL